ncbi:protein-L-isoaspartate O-methyltransferase [Aspergillus alliaceus]|uniref:Protein-L-isoaspartate O-methyltransferase n=2 Tax=Petromyces alliaceus TaxID=209559 RepID=A0A5N7CPG1_PETAA|nr:protein-L-isoaspartate O-methyltransferase [Aspergillus alliaceus]KAB8236714.1 protein-L-isoaspartate O-methyltransferase [Aspergillus alliaceus]KAE8395413.1 protein-L-isoaspartate O-methyltransferase [Aspergillus alliaceus]
MAWYCSGSTNAELVENLFRTGLVKNERVKRAMLGVDRAHYAPSRPYSDSPQPIGHGATISAPHMHGHACEYLIDFLKPGSRVLDIGSGSGYLTHVLANLVTNPSASDGLDGHVIGIDHIPELVDLSRENMRKSDQGRTLLDSAKVEFITADGRLGWKEGAPYDAIHVGAAAEKLHPVLIEQLRAPGRMFIPVDVESDGTAPSFGFGGGQYIWVVDKKVDGSVHKEKVFQVSYVPLTDPPKK